jgi:hypothetical protein
VKDCSQTHVVPANAGTHTPCHPDEAQTTDTFYNNDRRGLWVPAFAGTTGVRYSDASWRGRTT